MIGAADMAFPRLNALSYWLFLFGGIVLLGSFFAAEGAARTGWTGYRPCPQDRWQRPGPGSSACTSSTLSSLAGRSTCRDDSGARPG